MKKITFFILISHFTFVLVAQGQEINTTAATLTSQPPITSGVKSTGPQIESEFVNQRYEKRKPKHREVTSESKKVMRDVSEDNTAVEEKHVPVVSPLPTLQSQTMISTDTAPQPMLPQQKEDGKNVGEQVRDTVFGGSPEQIEKYRSYLDVEDVRKNILEFSLATSYLYNTSQSPYAYRNYINSGPAVALGIDIWFTPFVGIASNYKLSVLNEMKDSATQDRYVASSHTWFDSSLRFRRFFGSLTQSSSFEVGLGYTSYNLLVPTDAQTRLRQSVRGPLITLDLVVPSSKNFYWKYGMEVFPFQSHEETPANFDLRTGTSNQTMGVGANWGAEYRLSRFTQVFFKLSAQVFKSQFSGNTIANDPVTGSAGSNVSVTNTFYFLDIGVRMGR